MADGDTNRRHVPARAGGITRLPWESALFAAVEKLEEELRACKGERAKLQARVVDLQHRLENWQLRQETWRRERAELLGRLK
jgi:chromosome segregation ATPase